MMESFPKTEKSLSLTESQVWILMRALTIMSSPEQIRDLCIQFPQIDLDGLEDDLDAIIDQLELEE